jgi:hypothetical protein
MREKKLLNINAKTLIHGYISFYITLLAHWSRKNESN